MSRAPKPSARRLALCAALSLLALASAARADDDDGSAIAAVSSRLSLDYTRTRLPNGSYKPETYTFGEGGLIPGRTRDETIEKLTFLDVVRVIADPLRKKSFVPVPDRNPEDTQLLIMVYWGTTVGTADESNSSESQNLQRSQVGAPPPPPPESRLEPGQIRLTNQGQAQISRQSDESGEMAAVLAENWERDQADMKNAMILGYDSALSESDDVGSTPMTRHRDDLVTELEQDRYFVVLMAYDYQALWKHRKHRLLWATRFSVRARGNDFSRLLPSMVGYASQYFGVDTHGLLRRQLPEGRVEIGEPKSLGVVP